MRTFDLRPGAQARRGNTILGIGLQAEANFPLTFREWGQRQRLTTVLLTGSISVPSSVKDFFFLFIVVCWITLEAKYSFGKLLGSPGTEEAMLTALSLYRCPDGENPSSS